MSNLTHIAQSPTEPPLQVLSSTNHGPWLVVCAYILLILALMSIFVKLFTRYKITSRVTANDMYIIASIAFTVFQTIAITTAIHYGLGRRQKLVSASSLQSFKKAYYASNLLMILAFATAKASVPQLIVAIIPTRLLQRLCYASLAFTAAWAVASIFALAFQCRIPRPWEAEGNKCMNQFSLNIGVHSLNIITDLFVIFIPFVMIQEVQLSRRNRWIVRGLFASRLSVSIFIILMLYHMRKPYKSDNADFTWDILVPQVWAQIAINTSIITACIPSLKPFLSDIKPGLTIIQIPEHELTGPYVRKSKRRSRSDTTGSSRATARFAGRFSSTKKGNNPISSTSSSNSILWTEKQKQAIATMERGHNRPHAGKVQSRVEHGRSESIQGLTGDVILHSIDYKVEYEDVTDDLDFDSFAHLESRHR